MYLIGLCSSLAITIIMLPFARFIAKWRLLVSLSMEFQNIYLFPLCILGFMIMARIIPRIRCHKSQVSSCAKNMYMYMYIEPQVELDLDSMDGGQLWTSCFTHLPFG